MLCYRIKNIQNVRIRKNIRDGHLAADINCQANSMRATYACFEVCSLGSIGSASKAVLSRCFPRKKIVRRCSRNLLESPFPLLMLFFRHGCVLCGPTPLYLNSMWIVLFIGCNRRLGVVGGAFPITYFFSFVNLCFRSAAFSSFVTALK